MTSKIFTLNNLPDSGDIGLAYGRFDLVHAGHVRFLKAAKSKTGTLVVGVIPDNTASTSLARDHSQLERAHAVAELACVDYVLLAETDSLSHLIEKLKPTILALGIEYKNVKTGDIARAIEKQASKKRQVFFSAGSIETDSKLFYAHRDSIRSDAYREFRKILERNNLDYSSLTTAIEQWGATRIMVIGDTIVDRYIDCEALGISAEAPVLVVRENSEKLYVGGAAVVASQIAQFSNSCKFVSVIGDDAEAKFVTKKLGTCSIFPFFATEQDRPTTLKTRFLVDNQKVFRSTRLIDSELNSETEGVLIDLIEKEILSTDLIVISDFNYGVISRKILKKIQKLCKAHNCMLVGDLQCSSQYGSILKFTDFTLLCPTEKEARIALHDKASGVESIAQRLIRNTNTRKLLLKLGQEGFILYDTDLKSENYRVSFPALSAAAIDVTGAGDSMLAIAALVLASKQDFIIAGALGACIAALTVETLGNTAISPDRLDSKLTDIFSH